MIVNCRQATVGIVLQYDLPSSRSSEIIMGVLHSGQFGRSSIGKVMIWVNLHLGQMISIGSFLPLSMIMFGAPEGGVKKIFEYIEIAYNTAKMTEQELYHTGLDYESLA